MTSFQSAPGTDRGDVREDNEDVVLWKPECGLFAVVDGVGGDVGGREAAEITAHHLHQSLRKRRGDTPARLRRAITEANNRIFATASQDRDLHGMSCVLTAVVVDGDLLTVGHVGDSRLYRIADGAIRQITRDHSHVARQVRAGMMTSGEAQQHPERNVIYRSVGSIQRRFKDEEFIELHQLTFDDRSAWVLCSDGLSDPVPDERIRILVEASGSPKEAVKQLIAEAKLRNGEDNISIIVIEGQRFRTARRGSAFRRAPAISASRAHNLYFWRLLGIILTIAAAATVILGTNLSSWRRPPQPTITSPITVGKDKDFVTIRDALEGARHGQTIRVDPGEYPQLTPLTITKRVHLVSVTPRGAALVFKPRDAEAGLTDESGATTTSPSAAVVINKVTEASMRGFRIEVSQRFPTGIQLSGSAVLLEDLEISGATQSAILINGDDNSEIRYCILHSNPGSGMVADSEADTRILHNFFFGNRGDSLRLRLNRPVANPSLPLILGNRFAGNDVAIRWDIDPGTAIGELILRELEILERRNFSSIGTLAGSRIQVDNEAKGGG